MNSRALLSLLALAVAGLVVWAAFLRGGAEGPSQEPSPPATGAATDAPEIEPRSVDTPIVSDPDEVPADERLAMPDGTWVRALNGVKNPAELNWPSDRPYSPVVGTETREDGTQWYVHEDGSRHTTVMMWRNDLGRYDPATQLANPVEALPLAPGELPGPRLPEGGR